ncbi:hypothetical protein B0H14DRAFT_2595864 [Mycena olivaceomarginata]|nr:hypothetical protein B0H14DRAFT_2595864 [Mycena olivaceomarginata]
MSPSLRTTLPLDSELAMYRAGNDSEPALSVNHICGGNLIPIPTGFPVSGTHSFVYGHRVGNAGRYPPTLRVGAVGEVCMMAKDVTGAITSFFVQSPTTATTGGMCHQQATVALLFYVLDSEVVHDDSIEVMRDWFEHEEARSAIRYTIIGHVADGSIVSIEFTLHRYNHYALGSVKRVIRSINKGQEYNCIAHRIEVISNAYLATVGFINEDGGSSEESNNGAVTKVAEEFELMKVD